MAERAPCVAMSAAGNRFAVLDAFLAPVPGDPAALARRICAVGGLEPRPDGLLVLAPARRDGDVAMTLYNADGSRPEACGNGLRCVALLAVERGYASGAHVRVETDAGLRTGAVIAPRAAGRDARVRVSMGPVRVVAQRERLRAAGLEVEATLVDAGNPHCVIIVDDVRALPLEDLGPALERHARFPRGTNVELAALRGETLAASDGLEMRVWERGVGITRACGTGACAVARAASARLGLALPLSIHAEGGVLEVAEDEREGELALTGPVRLEGDYALATAAHAPRR